MKSLSVPLCALSVAVALTAVTVTPSKAEVIVNNVFSPGTFIQVGPGYGYGGPRYYSEPGYYDGPRYYGERRHREYPGYYEPSGYSGYYESGPRGPYCWHATDRDRGYGYWGYCHGRR